MKNKIGMFGLVIALALGAAMLTTGKAYALPPIVPKIGIVCEPGTVSGATHTFNLVAEAGYVQTPDGNSVYMWSFATPGAPGVDTFQYPGPVLCVTQGQTVEVKLHNSLPLLPNAVAADPTSIVFPGQDSAVTASAGLAGLLTKEVAPGGDITYSFVASQPGTYIYESGTDVSKQIEMGLYGALIVRPTAGANLAYGASTPFDPTREYMMLLSEYDPDLHHAIEIGAPYDFNTLNNRYYAVNGRSFPDTLMDNGVANLPTQPYGALVRIQPSPTLASPPALIRMLNVGVSNHPYHPHGNHLTEIAQDGRLLLSPSGASATSERFGETIGSGQTQDYTLRWDDVDLWSPVVPGHQLPVPEPNYRNLTFKDANTYYAANPYLGYQGTLPTGTVSQNVCGEWYFPWHSHALNEFTNYDQGFGGMGTLLRVDPLGGCFAAPTSTKILPVNPAVPAVLAGSLRGGTFASLSLDDANYYRINSTTTGTRTADWYAQFSGVASGSTNFVITYKGNNSNTTAALTPIAGVSRSIYIWNWSGAGSWVLQSGPTVTPAGDSQVVIGPIAAPGVYIGTGVNRGLVRIRVLSTNGATNFVSGGNLMKLVYTAP